ncbi:hypothetical protein OPQ81_004665 [Rhizoctonia solani]|nr:hypothetical protein OPQ81_004665 [Rhizoctonia solani]
MFKHNEGSKAFKSQDTISSTRPSSLQDVGKSSEHVTGLSELVLIPEATKRLMSRIGAPPKPADCFDVIAGYGTGGVLGMLQRLLEVAVFEYGEIIRSGLSKKSIGSQGMKMRECLNSVKAGAKLWCSQC